MARTKISTKPQAIACLNNWVDMSEKYAGIVGKIHDNVKSAKTVRELFIAFDAAIDVSGQAFSDNIGGDGYHAVLLSVALLLGLRENDYSEMQTAIGDDKLASVSDWLNQVKDMSWMLEYMLEYQMNPPIGMDIDSIDKNISAYPKLDAKTYKELSKQMYDEMVFMKKNIEDMGKVPEQVDMILSIAVANKAGEDYAKSLFLV